MSLETNQFLRSHAAHLLVDEPRREAQAAAQVGTRRVLTTARLHVRSRAEVFGALRDGKLAPDRTALLLVDCDSATDGMRAAAALDAARAAGLPVVFSQCSAAEQQPAPREGETVFTRATPGAFGEPLLEEHLALHGVDTLLVAGCGLLHAVHQTCVEALERGFRVVLLRDCTE
jgi:nicotinamidase-related amidase